MISYYIIPSNVHYVQNIQEIEKWEKTNHIDFNTPIVAVINESKIASHYTKFMVIYKGLMQTQGGSGSCYNPMKKTFLDGHNPMDNKLMPVHMSKWVLYNPSYLLRSVASAKFTILKKMGFKGLPYWYWDCENYDDIVGILIAKLDLIGLGLASTDIIKHITRRRKPQLMLTA